MLLLGSCRRTQLASVFCPASTVVLLTPLQLLPQLVDLLLIELLHGVNLRLILVSQLSNGSIHELHLRLQVTLIVRQRLHFLKGVSHLAHGLSVFLLMLRSL